MVDQIVVKVEDQVVDQAMVKLEDLTVVKVVDEVMVFGLAALTESGRIVEVEQRQVWEQC